MPRPCAVVFHVHCYQKWLPYLRSRCHGLVPWSFTFTATKNGFPICVLDATALCRGLSRSLLPKRLPYLRSRCHGLVPWSFTFTATKKASLSAFKMPRPCAVVFHVHCYQEGFPICVQD